MKYKHTITIADVQINIVTEEDPKVVEAMVGILDRRIREIFVRSDNRCPKIEAALLCALDYCSERIKSQRKVKALETKLAYTETALDELQAENDQLRQELADAENK